jgi:hypothetical protein
MPFMYSLLKSSDLSEHGNALASDAADALNQIRDYRRRHNAADLPFHLSDDPSSDYFMEKRNAIPSTHGTGWTNDPRGPVDTVYVSAR